MGKHFGELATIRGLITYKISPHEQRAFAGAISYGIPNMVRRFRECVFRVVPPFIVSYMIYTWAEATHHHSTRKNPRDYMYEVDPDIKEE
jgi:ubiquinol-cytochrome c reductase subunit 8